MKSPIHCATCGADPIDPSHCGQPTEACPYFGTAPKSKGPIVFEIKPVKGVEHLRTTNSMDITISSPGHWSKMRMSIATFRSVVRRMATLPLHKCHPMFDAGPLSEVTVRVTRGVKAYWTECLKQWDIK